MLNIFNWIKYKNIYNQFFKILNNGTKKEGSRGGCKKQNSSWWAGRWWAVTVVSVIQECRTMSAEMKYWLLEGSTKERRKLMKEPAQKHFSMCALKSGSWQVDQNVWRLHVCTFLVNFLLFFSPNNNTATAQHKIFYSH